MDTLSWVSLAVVATEWMLRLTLALRVIMRRAPVSVCLAWLVILLFLPVAGGVLYLLLGENRLGSRRARRHADVAHRVESEAVQLWRHSHVDWTATDQASRRLANLGTALSGLPPLRGNTLELLGSPADFIDRIVRDIDNARHHCHLMYYIWMERGRPIQVCDALARAAARGVACRVLVDSVGGRSFLRSPHAGRLRAAGVRVAEALPASAARLLLARLDLRNHRKIAVIDGHTAYAGSHNMTDETFGVRRGVGPWIDASLRIVGPAAHALQTVFYRDWLAEGADPLPPLPELLPDVRADGPSAVHVIPSGPGQGRGIIQQATLALLYSARDEIVITTPYFVPDEATKSALRNAALRGVSVTLVLPARLDTPLVAAASRSHWEDLLEVGVKILLHAPGLLHAKTIVVDRDLAMIGSANLDMRSFHLNFEVTLIVYDTDVASLLRFMQRGYMDSARQLSLDDWRRRPRLRVFAENVAQLFGPLL